MEKELNDLVKLLTEEHEIECTRPEKTVKALQESINRDYVHITFKKTETELGVKLYRQECSLNVDFENQSGCIHIVGGLILNYVKVKCIADINLSTCEGKGYIVPVTDEEYSAII